MSCDIASDGFRPCEARSETGDTACVGWRSFTQLLGNPKFDTINTTFLEEPFDWERIKGNAGACTVFHGEDDPYVPLSCGEDIAHHLGADLVVIPGGGHLNARAGYEEFEEILKKIESALQ